MSKKRNNLSVLGEKIAHKKEELSIYNRFKNADKVMDKTAQELRGRIIRKSYAITKTDLENIQLIKDKCLNKRIVLSESHIIRLAIKLAAALSEKEIIEASFGIAKMSPGRPKLRSD